MFELLHPLSFFHGSVKLRFLLFYAGSARICGQKVKKRPPQIKLKMQLAPIKGNKSESAEAIQQPKLVSIFTNLDIKRFQHTLIKCADNGDDANINCWVRCMFCRFAKPEKSLKVTRQLSGNVL